jgi:hypothetical protein
MHGHKFLVGFVAWQHCFISMLVPHLVHYLQLPSPYLLGAILRIWTSVSIKLTTMRIRNHGFEEDGIFKQPT